MTSSVRPFQGHTPVFADRVLIDPAAVVIGQVRVGADCSIWPGAVLRGDMNWIEIGERTSVQDGAVLHITHAGPYNPDGFPLKIGSDVTIGHKAVLHGCTIEDRVLIGMGAIVLDGAHIEPEVILAAGALVGPGKRLQSGWLYRGSPAKPARELTEQERAFFRYSATNYVRLKDQYLAEATRSPDKP